MATAVASSAYLSGPNFLGTTSRRQSGLDFQLIIEVSFIPSFNQS
jgi:hypothetical protein